MLGHNSIVLSIITFFFLILDFSMIGPAITLVLKNYKTGGGKDMVA